MSSSRTATRRLLKEVEALSKLQGDYEKGIERVGPISDDELFKWEAVINGQDVGFGYDGACSFSALPFIFPSLSMIPLAVMFLPIPLISYPKTLEHIANEKTVLCSTDGRWLLRITIPPTYPQKPPKMEFLTPIVHANVALQTGEICLDLLKDAWTPAYTVLECVRAVRLLLSCPGTDSPLNVDLAALLRSGDALGARKLVELWAEEERYRGK